ncbi:MAG: sensor histidine kinase, partial [Pseudomonadota bacterium]
REVDHRVKNNLAMVSSLIRMQLRTVRGSEGRAGLDSLANRVLSLAAVHERLHRAESQDRFDVAEFVRSLGHNLLSGLGVKGVDLKIETEPAYIAPSAASSLGIILNELITNSLKHAFPQGTGTLELIVKATDDEVSVAVVDDGIGIDTNLPRSASLGSRLIETLSRQVGATTLRDPVEKGTRFVVTLPAFSETQSAVS